ATAAMRNAAEYSDLVVAYRNGQPVKLKDVATVVDGVENDQIANFYSSSTNDERSIVLAVYKQPSANTVEIIDAIYHLLPTSLSHIPSAAKMELLADRSISIRDSVKDVKVTLAIAISLVVLVIFLFLRSVAATAIPALAVPISLIATCAAMYL